MDKDLLQYFIAKAGTTQKSLAKEINVTPETFIRKAKTAGLHKQRSSRLPSFSG